MKVEIGFIIVFLLCLAGVIIGILRVIGLL